MPGEFFGTGAAGDCTGIESWSFLNPDDSIELEIEKIGVLRNRLIANKPGQQSENPGTEAAASTPLVR